MKASIRIEFLVGETTIYRKLIPLNIEFSDFKMIKEKAKP
jgi:hypothetical protein